MFELFGIFEGTLEVRARGWAVVQAVTGIINFVVGTILLLAQKQELVVLEKGKNDPQFSFKITRQDQKVSITPLKQKRRVTEIITTYVPQWDAAFTVIVGAGFVIMGVLLLVAVHQKSIRKCTIWLVGTIPMCLAVFASSMHSLYLKPNLHDLTNGPMWSAYGYCIQIVYMYRKECVKFQQRTQINERKRRAN